MTILERLRNQAYWLMDRKEGGKVKKALSLLKDVEGDNPSEEQIQLHYKKCLDKLLRHCVETVPAYSGLKHLLDEDNPISGWPVVNKTDLKDNVDKHLSSKYDRDSLIAMSTSGSTGTPFVCYQDRGKKRHVNAEVLFYNGKIGYEIGRRIIYFRSIVGEVAKSSLQQFMQNIHLIDCQDLSDDSIAEKLAEIKRLSKGCGAMILSYASTLDAFRKYFDKHGFSEANGCNIYGVVSGSEMLQDITRNSISKAFGCPVVSRYANEENGFIGQDESQNNVFLHNRANYYIEILKMDSDEPAEPGETGKIVVTDLFNYAMPMVRYDTGDVGAWEEVMTANGKRRAIGSFGGRKVDVVYDCEGNAISPFAITNNMWQFQDIDQFQFVQKGEREYLIKVNSRRTFDEPHLIEVMRDIVGQEAKISIEHCKEIPVLASGKRRYIVNETIS